jgi:hypothetical protein
VLSEPTFGICSVQPNISYRRKAVKRGWLLVGEPWGTRRRRGGARPKLRLPPRRNCLLVVITLMVLVTIILRGKDHHGEIAPATSTTVLHVYVEDGAR